MHKNVYNILKSRIAQLAEQCRADIYPESVVLLAECAVTDEPIPFDQRLSLEYKSVSEGDQWGKEWQSGWFHITGIVPESFNGKELCLRLKTDSETMIFDETGTPLCGLTGYSIYDRTYYKDRFELKGYKGGDRIDFWFESAANRLTGIDLPEAHERDPKNPLGTYRPVIKSLRLCVFDREMWQFLLEMEVLSDLLNDLDPEQYQAKQLLHVLSKTVDIFNYDVKNTSAARKYLRETVFSWKSEDGSLTANTIGHAHIDIAWLWPLRESTRKAARTFSSQLVLMEEYPEFKFGASQAYLYKVIKENYPILFERIKEQIKAGRWEVQGGMFVEADCNLISGESMVRQFLHGKNFFKDEFGIDVKTHWIPDVFGYSAAMPQITRKAGCDYFLTQKISWNQVNEFPNNTFRWFGIDGTELLTHFPPENTYNAGVMPKERIGAVNRFKEGGYLPGFMSLVGIGDGGGGPAEPHIERARILKNLRGCPKTKWTFAKSFFQELEQYSSELPEWHGELYLEKHRGTLTTQAHTKRGNRKCEQALTALEALCSMLPAEDWPREQLDTMWKTLLANQFHDIIPGSSIRSVYERAEKEYDQILSETGKITKNALKKLFSGNDDRAVLINTLSTPWKGLVELPDRWNNRVIRNESGTELPSQLINGKKYVLLSIPGTSCETIHLGEKLAEESCSTGDFVMENSLIRYEFSPDGKLLHAFDKELAREILSAPGNELSLYNDHPLYFDAWDIDIYYRNEKKDTLKCVSSKPVEKGAAAMMAEFEYRTQDSVIRQKVVLANNSKRLDFITEADWHENRTLLRTAFPVTIRSEFATFDIQYAHIKRPTHNNTSWDVAMFESCGQRYADLSDETCGAAILTDCKYGYFVKGSLLDLALLRSPKYPDWFADQGKHLFTYSFLPHTGKMNESNVIQEAANLNRAPIIADRYQIGQAEFPCRIESEGISLEVIKRAEKDDSLILRLVETKGAFSTGILSFSGSPESVEEVDLMEWNTLAPLAAEGDNLSITLKPFEIKTLRVRL